VSEKYNLNQIIMKKTWILLTACSLIVVGLILHFTIGNQFSTGDYTCNYFAAGDFAAGDFACGIFAAGKFSLGIFSIGIFSVSIFNIGLYTIGIFALGWKMALPWWLENRAKE
jgi:hypothetical protein